MHQLTPETALLYTEKNVYDALGDGIVLLEALTAISPYHFGSIPASINRNWGDRSQVYTNYTLLVKNLNEFFKVKHGFYSPSTSKIEINKKLSREKVFASLMGHEKRLVSMRAGLNSSRSQQFLSTFVNLQSLNDLMETMVGVAINCASS